jgi:hypothetical protein
MATVAEYTTAVQNMLDAKANERNYDNINSAISYLNDENTQFAAEADACKAWRSRVWTKCYETLGAVQEGLVQPPSVEELVASLPELIWP